MSDARPAWSRDEFEAQLRSKEKYYHINHPYHVLMAEGKLNPEQIRGWVANRFYYQIAIPRKDSAIMANTPDREVRRKWLQRVLDHDGYGDDPGGIEAWIQLGIACGLSRDEMTSLKFVLPGVRFAVDAYVNFARTATWQEAACSSLTELFAPTIHNLCSRRPFRALAKRWALASNPVSGAVWPDVARWRPRVRSVGGGHGR